jgi:hypothetical protein
MDISIDGMPTIARTIAPSSPAAASHVHTSDSGRSDVSDTVNRLSREAPEESLRLITSPGIGLDFHGRTSLELAANHRFMKLEADPGHHL